MCVLMSCESEPEGSKAQAHVSRGELLVMPDGTSVHCDGKVKQYSSRDGRHIKWCENRSSERHGVYVEFIGARKVLSGQYYHGKKFGQFHEWHTQPRDQGAVPCAGVQFRGKEYCLSRVSSYDRHGVLHGSYQTYDRHGHSTKTCTYEHGIVAGIAIEKRWFQTEDGDWLVITSHTEYRGKTVISKISYTHDGFEFSTMEFDTVTKVATKKQRYAENQPQSESFLCAGWKCGTHKRWHRNGQLAFQCEYKNNTPVGKCYEYNEDGSVHWYVRFTLDARDPVKTVGDDWSVPTSNFIRVPFTYDGVTLPDDLYPEMRDSDNFQYAVVYRDGKKVFEAERSKGLTEYSWFRKGVRYYYVHIPDKSEGGTVPPIDGKNAYEEVRSRNGDLHVYEVTAGYDDSEFAENAWTRRVRHGCAYKDSIRGEDYDYQVYKMGVRVCPPEGSTEKYCKTGCDYSLLK